jgi:hypothetical protein
MDRHAGIGDDYIIRIHESPSEILGH